MYFSAVTCNSLDPVVKVPLIKLASLILPRLKTVVKNSQVKAWQQPTPLFTTHTLDTPTSLWDRPRTCRFTVKVECPYAFLEEFCRYCDIQPVPAGSTSEDYRLKAIPFVLKGDAGVCLSRLPEGSIRTWAEFRMIFLDRFFPASKTSALKRFQGLLQACPNHKLGEREIYSIYYSGLTMDSKNDLNLATQGDFLRTPFSQAKNILERLIEAKRSYKTSRGQYRRGAVHAAEARNDEKLEARFEQMEKKLLEAVEKARPPPTPAPKETQ
ncbi:hypothetical protein SASPL_133457 [Salvia splendens]|uniref:Retrotransposon gag domain-containing protein n=1 Tax=Salvia splendens TaxID=180675 RepID=A0A8X8X328_SALSN|nr:hypothetical protein SASPL_133457 [Salvia splendens]